MEKEMHELTAYLDAHPLLWVLVGIFVLVTILRIVARLACLAVMAIIGISVIAAVAGVLGRII